MKKMILVMSTTTVEARQYAIKNIIDNDKILNKANNRIETNEEIYYFVGGVDWEYGRGYRPNLVYVDKKLSIQTLFDIVHPMVQYDKHKIVFFMK